jgi:hypothetical protein
MKKKKKTWRKKKTIRVFLCLVFLVSTEFINNGWYSIL